MLLFSETGRLSNDCGFGRDRPCCAIQDFLSHSASPPVSFQSSSSSAVNKNIAFVRLPNCGEAFGERFGFEEVCRNLQMHGTERRRDNEGAVPVDKSPKVPDLDRGQALMKSECSLKLGAYDGLSRLVDEL